MAQNKNSRKAEGLCQKIRNAMSPFKSRIRRISHQPQPSISITTDKIPQGHNNENAQTKAVHVLHQPSKMIPVEFNHFSAQNSKKIQSEIVIVREKKFGKSASEKKGVATPERVKRKPPNHDQGRSKKDDDDDSIHEGKFSDYISKVKNRMIKTASNVRAVEKNFSLK